MRIRLILTTGALVLACASLSTAQTTQASADSGPTLFGLKGTIDFGYRGTSDEGDGARYERYRDLRSGLFTRINLGAESATRLVDVNLFNIGYRDQSYDLGINAGKVKVGGFFNGIPLNYSYLTSTPWVETSTGVFTLDPAARTAVQNKVAGIVADTLSVRAGAESYPVRRWKVGDGMIIDGLGPDGISKRVLDVLRKR